MPATRSISPTGNINTNGVLSGVAWGVSNLTYSFPTSGSFYGSGYGYDEHTTAFEALNAAQQAAAKSVLTAYSKFANLTFTQVTESASTHGDLRFAETDEAPTAHAYYPTTAAEGGDVWLNNSSNTYDNPVKGGYAYATLLHEIGHALGLKHPHSPSGSFAAMPTATDSMEFTVMSYRSYIGASTSTGYTNEQYGFAQSLMMYDIAGVQAMYGANFNTNAGNTTYTWSATTGAMSINGVSQGAPGANRIFLTVWDGGGADTYDFSNYTTNLSVNLAPGGWTTTATAQLAKLHYNGSQVARGNIANALLFNGDVRSLIENAVGGSGNDVMVGNQASNRLTGNGGNDTLKGAQGNDTIIGSAGSDTAVFSGTRADYRIELALDLSLRVTDLRTGSPDGTDIVLGIENLKFADRLYTYVEIATPLQVELEVTIGADGSYQGTPNADAIDGTSGADVMHGKGGNDALRGAAGGDSLYGGEGNDSLDGGTGADRMEGGTGNDTYFVDNTQDRVYERNGEGSDLVKSSASFSLSGQYAENLHLTGTAAINGAGNEFRNKLIGNAAANTLNGGAGNDEITGGGGRDVLTGGTGYDDFNFRSLAEMGKTAATRDVITDFTRGMDDIDLSAIDANSHTAANDAFIWIGKNAFSGKAGQLHYVQQNFSGTSNDKTIVEGDVNGDGKADFQIELSKLMALSSSDFFL